MSIVVGLIGKARSGKTTIAEHWRDRYGFEIISFADALKEMVLGALQVTSPPAEVVDWPEVSAPDWRKLIYTDRTPFTRWLLQFIGTDIIRNRVDTAFWTNQGVYKIDAAMRRGAMVVVPDMRFVNESLVVRAFAGDIVRVVREGEGSLVEAGASHASEVESDDIIEDYKLSVPTGREALLAAADKLLDSDLRSIH